MGGQKMMQKTGQGVLRHSIRPAEAPARRPAPCLLYTLMSGGAVTNLNDQRAQKTMSRLVQGCFATPPAGAKASLCCLAIAVLVCACSGPSTLAETVIIADLRANYDASTPIAGQSSIGKIPDTLGTGSWNFYGAATVGGALTPLTYDTSADGGRLANAYTLQGQVNDLPAIANHEIYSGQGGNPR